MFASFAIPSYRYQWSADVLGTWAFEMETLILGWWVLVETDSAVALSVFGALRFGGTLLGPFFGVVADRMSRRSLLLAMRALFAVLAAAIAILGLQDSLVPWQVFVIATLSGLVRPSEMVLRQSLIADTVPRHLLMNALGFSRSTADSARIVGALLGAGLLSALGIGAAYLVVTAFYLGSVALTARIARPPRRSAVAPARPLEELRLGVRYMRAEPAIMTVMALAFLVNLTGFPLVSGLMPAVAREVFGFDENGLARMLAVAAAGALTGSLVLAGAMRALRPEPLMIGAIVAWHVLILAFASVSTPWVGYALLGAIGAATSVSMIPMSVVLMSATDPAFRGRVMGVRMLAVYSLPLGLLAGGFMIERVGVGSALTVFAVAGIGGALLGGRRVRRLARAG
ncbi:MAG: MFS transporter [Ectothiorhodospiraceae bacterium]|nr:MFS transporter [Ectothiorhodospiraceae bacterium]